MKNKRQVLLTLGWFRCGTTHLYNKVKKMLPAWMHYYEPFNPMLGYFCERYNELKSKNPDREVILEIKQHAAVLFQEYFQLPEVIEKYYRPHFGACDFFVGPSADFPELEDYLRGLAAVDTAVHFQINRGFGRIGFIENIFPDAKLLTVIRDPRAVWASWHNQPKNPFSEDLPADKFKIDQMVRELNDILSDNQKQHWGFSWAAGKPPLAMFLIMWSFLYGQLLYRQNKFKSETVVRFEDLTTNPELILKQIADKLNLSVDLNDTPASYRTPAKKWLRKATPGDYDEFLKGLPDAAPLWDLLDKFDYK